MKKTALMTLAAIAGATVIAGAQEGPKGPKGQRRLPPEVIAKFDKDGDGKLTGDERKAAMEARRAMREERRGKMLEKFDKDGDGKLTGDERKAAMEARRAMREERRKRAGKKGGGAAG